MTRVLIVAPSAVVRAGLESLLAGSPTLEVVGSAPGLDALPARVASLHPDVILIELERERDPELGLLASLAPIVLLGDESDSAAVTEALRHGVRAVLPREAAAEEIVAAVEAAAAGLLALHPTTADTLLPLLGPLSRSPTTAGAETLTPREIEVLGMLAEGAGNKLIARRLGISEHTVKFHVGSILAKLNASSRTEAVTLGVRQGLIML